MLAWNRGRREAWDYAAPDEHTVVRATDTLHGGAILPGFSLKVEELFSDPAE